MEFHIIEVSQFFVAVVAESPPDEKLFLQ